MEAVVISLFHEIFEFDLIVADVLQTNDSLVKVMDVYKDKIGLASLDQPSSPPPTSPWQGSFTPPSAPSARTNQPEGKQLTTRPQFHKAFKHKTLLSS